MDGTFTAAKGGFMQVMTIMMGIVTMNGKERLTHVLNIHMKNKDGDSYSHAFTKMWNVIERYAQKRIKVDCFSILTDAEFGIGKGLRAALNARGIECIVSFCSTHTVRNLRTQIKKKTPFKVIPPPVRLTIQYLASLVRFLKITQSLISFFLAIRKTRSVYGFVYSLCNTDCRTRKERTCSGMFCEIISLEDNDTKLAGEF